MKEKKGFLLRTVKQLNIGVAVCGGGFLLYIVMLALGVEKAADAVSFVFGLVSVYVFVSAADVRSREKDSVSLSLLWGAGALMIMLCACAVLALKLYLGL